MEEEEAGGEVGGWTEQCQRALHACNASIIAPMRRFAIASVCFDKQELINEGFAPSPK